jgi:hypothetical protein
VEMTRGLSAAGYLKPKYCKYVESHNKSKLVREINDSIADLYNFKATKLTLVGFEIS